MTKKIGVYQSYIDELRRVASTVEEARFVALQLLTLHTEVIGRKDAVVLELGVDRGQSTKIFLNAVDGKPSSRLVSVDIRDCSSVSDSDKWTFVQEDSANIAEIVKAAPVLEAGIDIIYIDSLHTAEHVRQEIFGWFPYLNKGGVMFFDDVDSGPYLLGQRKDSLGTELANRKIFELIEAVFRANMENCNLALVFGSTGLARVDKISELGSALNEPLYIPKRRIRLYWHFFNFIFRRNQYKHNQDNNESFLIDVTRY